MSRSRTVRLTAVLVALALAGLGIIWWKTKPSSDLERPEAGSAQETPTPAGPSASIYFPATSGMLEPEVRPVPPDLEPSARTRWLAEQLAAGPEREDLRPALPAETQVAGVFAAPDGTVFVDFTIPESAGMGSTEELLALYSVVNTVLLDDEAARRTVLLINGRQRETLAGHLDTSRPLYPRPDLIREPG